MKDISSHITINAPRSLVWDVFLDFGNYPEWNPFIVEISGTAALGARLETTMLLHGKPHQFHPKVIRFEPERELRWIGRFGMPGLFDGEHIFRFQEAGPERTVFTQGEKFTGLLVPFFRGSLRETEHSFDKLNVALKKRCEAIAKESH